MHKPHQVYECPGLTQFQSTAYLGGYNPPKIHLRYGLAYPHLLPNVFFQYQFSFSFRLLQFQSNRVPQLVVRLVKFDKQLDYLDKNNAFYQRLSHLQCHSLMPWMPSFHNLLLPYSKQVMSLDILNLLDCYFHLVHFQICLGWKKISLNPSSIQRGPPSRYWFQISLFTTPNCWKLFCISCRLLECVASTVHS